MKKLNCLLILLAVGFLTSKAEAAPRNTSYINTIGPAVAVADVVVSSAASMRNCIDFFDYVATTTSTFRIMNGTKAAGTAIYSRGTLTSGTTLNRTWDASDPICADPGLSLTLTSDSTAYSLSYQGYSYQMSICPVCGRETVVDEDWEFGRITRCGIHYRRVENFDKGTVEDKLDVRPRSASND